MAEVVPDYHANNDTDWAVMTGRFEQSANTDEAERDDIFWCEARHKARTAMMLLNLKYHDDDIRKGADGCGDGNILRSCAWHFGVHQSKGEL